MMMAKTCGEACASERCARERVCGREFLFVLSRNRFSVFCVGRASMRAGQGIYYSNVVGSSTSGRRADTNTHTHTRGGRNL